MHIIQLSDYQISYGDVNQALSEYLNDKKYTSISVIVDENTKEHCLNKLTKPTKSIQLIEIPSGEKNKGLNTCESIWSQMVEYKIDRKGLIINLGGGVIGDMGGFAASSYMRGIEFIQIPTSLLSQVDASIGGKLAVDFKGLKNIIGLFKNPKEVIVDYNFIKTLSPEEFRSGFAEMIKHALIRDKAIWNRYLDSSDWRSLDWNYEIAESILVKKEVVEIDPKEQGLRKILNFGHTIGHAVESVSFETKNPLLHGEAIAIGMICESYLSVLKSELTESELSTITNYILSIYDDLNLEVLGENEEIIEKLKNDKKNQGGRFLFSLLSSIGTAIYDIEVNTDEINKSLQYLLSQSK